MSPAHRSRRASALLEIDTDNLGAIPKLQVAPGQEQFVASNAVSIAQACFHRDTAPLRGGQSV